MDTCEQILQQLCDELSEDIDSELCASLRQHLKDCPDCRAQLQSMRTAVHLFRCMKEAEVPPEIHRRLFKLLNVEAAE